MINRKNILVAAILALVFSGACLAVNLYVCRSVTGRISHNVESFEKTQAVLLLGAGVYGDKRVSSILEDRIIAAVDLYKKGKASKILVSGDHGTVSYDEVNVIKLHLVNNGIPESDIFTDHAGFSTYDSIIRAKDVFCVQSMIIVSQKYHLFRALYIADRCGLKIHGYPADRQNYKKYKYYMAREAAARTKDFIKIIFKIKPKFLGGKIPITGDGSKTRG